MSKREEKMRGGLDALLGGGRTAPATTKEQEAALDYEEELLLMEKEQAPADGAEPMGRLHLRKRKSLLTLSRMKP